MCFEQEIQPLKITRGDSDGYLVYIEGREFVAGDKVELTVRKKPESPSKAIHKTVTEFVDGKATIIMNPEDTSNLSWGEYVYDVQVTFEDGIVKTIIPVSPFTIDKESTYD